MLFQEILDSLKFNNYLIFHYKIGYIITNLSASIIHIYGLLRNTF